MFFGKRKKEKEKNPAPIKQEETKTSKASSAKNIRNSAPVPDTTPVLPSEHALVQLARRVPDLKFASRESDFYGGPDIARPFCFSDFERFAADHLRAYRDNPGENQDAALQLWMSGDRMEAWIVVLPPAGGEDITAEQVEEAIAQKNIKECRNEEAIALAKTPKGYLRLLCVAKGRPAQNGENGRVISLIPECDPHFKVDEKGRINFADRNWIVNVDSDQHICEVVPPTEGVDGIDLYGKPLRAKNGKAAAKVNGKNTSFIEEGHILKADKAGQLIRTGDRFAVNDVLNIKGDVDLTTGNIKSNSTVVINGNVKPNFKVESKGDVIVRGTVEWGTIIAGHDINVNGGITAGDNDYIQAGNDIHCKFMENGRAYCGGDAYFENLVLSEVSAEGSIFVTSGRGTVVAGSLTAMGDIRVNQIGNRSYRATLARIGPTSRFREKLQQVSDDLEATRETVQTARSNVSKLQKNKDDLKIRMALQSQKSLLAMGEHKLENLERRYEELSEKAQDTKRRRVYADVAHPNVTITIGDESMVVQHEIRYSAFMLRNHNIELIPQ